VRRLALPVVLVAVALAGAGCDLSKPGGEVVAPAPTTVEGEVPKSQQGNVEVPQQFTNGDPGAGKQVFASAGCGGCHTLRAAGSNGNVGPNLDQSNPDLELIVQRVRKGGGGMPPFEDNLSAEQIRDVAAFVFDSTRVQSD